MCRERGRTGSSEVILYFERVFQQLLSLFTVLPRFEGRLLYEVSKVVSLTMREESDLVRERKFTMIVGANLRAADVIIQPWLVSGWIDGWILERRGQGVPRTGKRGYLMLKIKKVWKERYYISHTPRGFSFKSPLRLPRR